MKYIPGITMSKLAALLSSNQDSLPMIEQYRLFLSLLKAFRELTSSHIYHGDLGHHEGNVLVSPLTWEVNIIDFNKSIFIDSQKKLKKHAQELRDLLDYTVIDQYITDKYLIDMKLNLLLFIEENDDLFLDINKAIEELEAKINVSGHPITEEEFTLSDAVEPIIYSHFENSRYSPPIQPYNKINDINETKRYKRAWDKI